MNKEFIPYEQALALKELGFDEPCLAFYDGKGTEQVYFNSYRNGSGDYEPFKKSERLTWFGAPLYQQAFRWFRDKKLCDGSVCRHGDADGGYSYCWEILCEYGVYEHRHFKKGYKTYEEAELACLNKLIEIIKNK